MATKKAPARKKAAAKISKPIRSAKKAPARSARVQELSPCLWFDGNGEEAARFYCSVFKKSKILNIAKYPPVGQEIHGGKAGSVMTVEFMLNGLKFLALNGGPLFKFNEAISMQVICETQDEIDYYWEKLGEGGDPAAQQCGWLKDKFGLSWQITPKGWEKLYKDPNSAGTQRAFKAMIEMKKLDIAALNAAYKGK